MGKSYEYLQGVDGRREIIYREKGKLKEHKKMNQQFGKHSHSRQVVVLNEKGDTINQILTGERDTINLNSTDRYYRKGKLKYTWINEFHPNQSQKKTTVYNGKGKTKYVWDYQCKDEGVEVKKHKETSTICVSKQYDKDSSYTSVYHLVSPKGVLTKTIYRYSRYKTILYYKSTSGPDDRLNYKVQYTYKNDTILSKRVSKYYIKGALASEYIKGYDGNGELIADVTKTFRKGELRSENRVIYKYDAFGRPMQRISADVTDGERSIWFYAYE